MRVIQNGCLVSASPRTLHLAIAEAAGNRLAADFTGAIRESIRGPLLDAIRDVAGWEDLIETLRADHRRLYAAIERGDADAAESLVEDHIRSAWRQLRPGVPAPMVASEVRARR